jgi:hypothetical protein
LKNYFEQTETIQKTVGNAETNSLRGINKTKISSWFSRNAPTDEQQSAGAEKYSNKNGTANLLSR